MIRLAIVTTLLTCLAGCSSVSYYSQAVRGHFDLMGRRQPIAPLLEDPPADMDLELRNTLARVLQIRAFATEALALPDNDSYRSYADLERSHVVWNVVAAPEFSLAPKTWCFLFVGCLSYKGYFDRERAEREARRLREDGYDVVVGGVAAYSTLGRFPDPFLNTMVGYSEARTASLIFHELAHQQLYVKGETAFNEAFATFVAEEGVTRWLGQQGPSGEAALRRWQEREQRRRQFTRLVLSARDRLAVLYSRDLDAAAMRAAKAEAFERLRERYARLRDSAWGGYAGYDAWFEELNNAKLASVATYRGLVPAFAALLAQADGDFARFFELAEALGEAPEEERRRRLQELLAISRSAAKAGALRGPVTAASVR